MFAGFAFLFHITIFSGIDTSTAWKHTSCTVIALASRFPHFSVWKLQLAIQSSCEVTSLCPKSPQLGTPALEAPLADLFTHSSFLHTSPWVCSLLRFSESHCNHNWLFSLKTEQQQISYLINSFHPQGMTDPFAQIPVNSSSLWLGSTPSLIVKILKFTHPDSWFISCPIQSDQACASAMQDDSKVRSIFFEWNSVLFFHVLNLTQVPAVLLGLYQPVSISTRLFPLLPSMGHLYRGQERSNLCSPGMQVRSRGELWPHWNSMWSGSLAAMVFTLQWNNQSNSWYLILNSCDFEWYRRKPCNSF